MRSCGAPSWRGMNETSQPFRLDLPPSSQVPVLHRLVQDLGCQSLAFAHRARLGDQSDMNQFFPEFPEPRPIRPKKLNTGWNADDRIDVTAHAKTLRFRMRWSRDEQDAAVYQMYQDGYSATDIGTTFGVTRERARQWLAGMGLRTKGALPRKWSDKLNQFIPCSTSAYADNGHVEALRLWQGRRLVFRKKWLAGKLKQYVDDRGYVPGSTEFCEAMTGRPRTSAMAFIVGGLAFGRHKPYAEVIAEIYEIAGFKKPTYGAASLYGVRLSERSP